MNPNDPTDRTHACVQACQQCAAACDHCASACLSEQHVQEMRRCIALDVDCADLCRLCATLMARGSAHAPDICRVCAQACDACGTECAQHAHEHCQACAKACRLCAQACKEMAGA